jgi:hypothetical protein
MENDSIISNWQSQQVASILIIIFFGIISIVYVFFTNTYILRENESILNSKFKIPFLLFTLLSSIIIIIILSINISNYTGIAITFIILINFFIFGFKIIYKSDKFNEIINSSFSYLNTIKNDIGNIGNIEFIDYIAKFFDYGAKDCDDRICNFLNDYNFSLISPFIIALFLYLAIKTSNVLMYSIFTIVFVIEFLFKRRFNTLIHFYSEKKIQLIIYFCAFTTYNLLLYLA